MRRKTRWKMMGCVLAVAMTAEAVPSGLLAGICGESVYAQDAEVADSSENASVSCQLVLNSQKLTPGAVFTIDVNLLTNPGLTLADGTFTYDENVLELQSELKENGNPVYKVVSHDLFYIDGKDDSDFISPIPHDGQVRLMDGYSLYRQNSDATGTMFTLTFKVKEDAPVGTTVTFSYAGKMSGYLTDDKNSKYVIDCQDLEATIECAHQNTTEEIVKAPTDTETGLKNIICSSCNEVIGTEVIPALGNEETPPDDGNPVTETGFRYQLLENGTIEITGYEGTAEVITIPETIDGVAVTGIGKNAFFGNSKLTEIRLPDSITSIGAGAFYDCSSLKKIKLSKKIQEMYSYNGGGAIEESSLISNPFVGCSSLEKIELAYDDDSYLQAADGILYRLYSSGEIELLAYPANKQNKTCSVIEGINIIGLDAFNGCSNLNEITIPEGVTRIAKGSFANCANLEKVDLPLSLATIENGAFDSSENVVLSVYADSYADTYAKDNGLKTELKVKILYGDVNGDGEVSLTDSALIRRYLAGWNVSIDEQIADVNGDGEVSLTDSALIRRYLAGWNVTFRTN